MSTNYETVGTLIKIFSRHKCIGFIPIRTITKGDVLTLKLRVASQNEPRIDFTVKSMEVDHIQRDSVEPGEQCAIQIDPFPNGYVKIGDPVLAIAIGDGRKTQRTRTHDSNLQMEGTCFLSPSSKHEWEPGFKRPYQYDIPKERCKYCGQQKQK
jgi:hypothetical protein